MDEVWFQHVDMTTGSLLLLLLTGSVFLKTFRQLYDKKLKDKKCVLSYVSLLTASKCYVYTGEGDSLRLIMLCNGRCFLLVVSKLVQQKYRIYLSLFSSSWADLMGLMVSVFQSPF